LAIRIWDGARLPKAKQRRFSREEALEVKKQLEDEHLKGGTTAPNQKNDIQRNNQEKDI
jgi:hypothetical protein